MRIALVLGLALLAATVTLPAATADHAYCIGEHPLDWSKRNCDSTEEWLADPDACHLPHTYWYC